VFVDAFSSLVIELLTLNQIKLNDIAFLKSVKVTNRLTTFTALPCPFLSKPHPCLFTYVQAKLGHKYNK